MTDIEVCKDRKVENVSSTVCAQYSGAYLKIVSRNFRGNFHPLLKLDQSGNPM